MRLQAAGVALSDYLERLERGGIVEERIVGREIRSPSVQLELGPFEARIVSTHDQIISDDTCVGCRFPASPGYAQAITESARRIGELLVEAGAIGRAAIDFVVARDRDGSWRTYAIELNLRKGATTHPLTTLELLSGGAYDADAGASARPAAASATTSPPITSIRHACARSVMVGCSASLPFHGWTPTAAGWCSTCSARWTSSGGWA